MRDRTADSAVYYPQLLEVEWPLPGQQRDDVLNRLRLYDLVPFVNY